MAVTLRLVSPPVSDVGVSYTVAEDITFDEDPSPQHPEIHTNALIHCKVSGEPKPDVTWRYGGKRISFRGESFTDAAENRPRL